MAGISAVIAVIALFAALGALWMVTEAVKKIDLRTRRVVESQTKGMKSSFSELAHLVQKNNKTQEAMVSRIRDVVKSRESANLEIKELKHEIESLKNQQPANSANGRRKA
ncbi:MAG: hypothetical protein ISR45_00565 [Rhodospirillales bacterium]|nr:hypothetical protein [Rhodospirillales bacterium]